ncbi:dihydroorotate dehydrogenase (quinone) [Candidatus Saccharibacteria bacterium]|nr:dihydroorotate dehydrogenase (quinone) [Candidatus Saccharibacteria bacterium]
MYIMYKKIIKPILFLFSPDFVHNFIAGAGRFVQAIPPVRWLLRAWWRYDNRVLQQRILDVDFVNPVGLSAGFDKNVQLTPLIESVGFGFETAGSVTLAPRRGNPRPWFYRLPKSGSLVVNAGMANLGLVKLAPRIRRNARKLHGMPLSISVAVVAKSKKETCEGAIIDAKNAVLYIIQHNLAQMVEINISCPNVGGVPFAEPRMLDKLLTVLDKLERDMPFFVKMPYMENMKHFDILLRVISRHNIQGVTVANLIKERDNLHLSDPLPETVRGGLSGIPTRAHNVEMIRHAYQFYGDRLIIIGVGGIFSAQDAYEKIRAGASLVALVTGMIFEGPQVVGRINRELVALLQKDGFHTISEAVGADYKKRAKKSTKSSQKPLQKM